MGALTPVTCKRLKFSSHRLSVPELFAKWEAAMKGFRSVGIGQDIMGTIFVWGGGWFHQHGWWSIQPKKMGSSGMITSYIGTTRPNISGCWSRKMVKVWFEGVNLDPCLKFNPRRIPRDPNGCKGCSRKIWKILMQRGKGPRVWL